MRTPCYGVSASATRLAHAFYWQWLIVVWRQVMLRRISYDGMDLLHIEESGYACQGLYFCICGDWQLCIFLLRPWRICRRWCQTQQTIRRPRRTRSLCAGRRVYSPELFFHLGFCISTQYSLDCLDLVVC
uniref:Uncharacterized protein n=1 Tax=Oryza brachyantha TaxID=4533 RepID=J3KWD9_ORYBR